MRKMRVKLRPKLQAITPNNYCAGVVEELRRLADDIEAGKCIAVVAAADFRPTDDMPNGSARIIHRGDWMSRLGLACRLQHDINEQW